MVRLKALFVGISLLVFTSLALSSAIFDAPVHADPHVDSQCSSSSSFFGLPTWYANLPLQVSSDGNSCSVVLTDPNDAWIIVLNVINILLRLTGIVAVIFIVIGGIRYITSQGESAGITAAKQTIIRAITGLVIAIVAILIVTYVSSIFGQKVDQNNNYHVSVLPEEYNA